MIGSFDITIGYEAQRHDEIVSLPRDYEAWLGVPVCFYGFEEELAELPGVYAPPSGALILTRSVSYTYNPMPDALVYDASLIERG